MRRRLIFSFFSLAFFFRTESARSVALSPSPSLSVAPRDDDAFIFVLPALWRARFDSACITHERGPFPISGCPELLPSAACGRCCTSSPLCRRRRCRHWIATSVFTGSPGLPRCISRSSQRVQRYSTFEKYSSYQNQTKTVSFQVCKRRGIRFLHFFGFAHLSTSSLSSSSFTRSPPLPRPPPSGSTSAPPTAPSPSPPAANRSSSASCRRTPRGPPRAAAGAPRRPRGPGCCSPPWYFMVTKEKEGERGRHSWALLPSLLRLRLRLRQRQQQQHPERLSLLLLRRRRRRIWCARRRGSWAREPKKKKNLRLPSSRSPSLPGESPCCPSKWPRRSSPPCSTPPRLTLTGRGRRGPSSPCLRTSRRKPARRRRRPRGPRGWRRSGWSGSPSPPL